MWARVVEMMLGLWLLLSPFIFRHPTTAAGWWANDLACGAAVIVIGAASFWGPLRRAHLAQIAVGLWLIGFGYLTGAHPNPPALQNNIIVGLCLLMFAIIPSEASQPPPAWRKYIEQH